MYPLRVLNRFNPKNSDVRIMGRTFTAQGNPPGFYFKWEKCAGYMFSMLIQKSWDHHNPVSLWDAYFEGKYNDGYLGPERNYGELSFFGSGENLVTIKCNNLTSAVLNGEQLIDGATEDPTVVVQFSGADPTFYYMSCNGDVTIESSKSGSVVHRTYNDLDRVSVAVEADANTPVKIYGDVTELYTTGSVITDIDVTNCENLVTLGAQGSTFAHIDISQNALLQTLDLLNNSALEDLDYTNNPDLTTLKLSNNTHITAIDVTDKTALTTLVLENMPITTLDLTYNTLLETLSLAGCTGITSLDLTHNTLLETLSLAGCTGIMSLDLQTLTALTTLDCSGLPITTLDLTYNTLTSLTCTGCSAVATIYAHATNSDVATALGDLMTANSPGTLYTYSNDAYFDLLKTAALAAGWSIYLYDSPYDQAATMYFLTTYSNYWSSIKQYGIDHPELVPYIEEDNDLIISLVDGLGWRFATPQVNGSHFFTSMVYGNGDIEIEADMKIIGAPSINTVFSGIYNGSRYYFNGTYRGYVLTCAKLGTWGTNVWAYDTISDNTPFVALSTIKANGVFQMKKDNNPISSNTGGQQCPNPNINIVLFGHIDINGVIRNTNNIGEYAGKVRVKASGTEHKFAPFVRNGQVEFLDLTTLQLCTRAGNFSIEKQTA